MKTIFRQTALILGVTACAMSPALAAAQEWPNRPVTLIVPFNAGGATDSVARRLAEQLQQLWGQPVLIDNRPGAGTIIGTNAVAKAPADGYTMGLVVSAHTINPSLRPNLPYDTVKDFAGVTQIGRQHMVMAANPDLEADNVAELLELARQRPEGISYATPGTGTALHLTMELLKTQTGANFVHIPYKGGVPAQQDVVGGQVPVLLDIYHSSKGLIDAGRLKTLALLSPERPAALADVPVIAETVPGVSAMSMIGIVAPAGTPPGIVKKASADIAGLVRSEDFAHRLQEMDIEPVGSAPEEFDALIRTEIDKWAPAVKASGAKVD